MLIKKTRSELKELALGWKDKTVDFMKKQESWKVLVGGIVLGGILVLLAAIVLPLLFFTVIISLMIYFMAPETLDDIEKITKDENNNDKD